MQKLILIGGKAESGKDYSAKYIKKYLENKNKKVIILHFADELKFYAKEYFGWNGNKDKLGRFLLQSLGTDIVRSRCPDYWVESVARFIRVFQNEFDYFLIPDLRFPNESNYFKNNDYPVIVLKTNRLNYQNSLTPEQRLHKSEVALDDYIFDYEINAESGVENLERELDIFITIFDL